MTQDLTTPAPEGKPPIWVCHKCRELAAFEPSNFIGISYEDIRAILAERSDVGRWHCYHDECSPDNDENHGGFYAITLNQIATWPQVNRWESHFAEKNWFDKTNWFEFVLTAAGMAG